MSIFIDRPQLISFHLLLPVQDNVFTSCKSVFAVTPILTNKYYIRQYINIGSKLPSQNIFQPNLTARSLKNLILLLLSF